MDEVFEPCGIWRAFAEAPQLRVDLIFLGDTSALRAMAAWPKYSLLISGFPKGPQGVWGVPADGGMKFRQTEVRGGNAIFRNLADFKKFKVVAGMWDLGGFVYRTSD